jgi:two-component system cell cycle sensor histidine kinase/response regulator CckA
VAHDFNNLLTVITGYAAFLEEDLSGTVHVPDIVQIRSAVERGARLTGQLLAFSRRKPSNPEPFDVEVAVGGVLELTHRVLGEGVEVIRTTPSAPLRVRMDPGAFEQALMNLILNARDAMGGQGRLLVEVSRCALDADQVAVRGVALPPGDYARVSITDNGPGMTAEILDQVFDPFFTTKQDSGGTGLGLASAYGLVQQANGTLTAYSEPGMGATFRVYLPAVSDEAERGASAPAPVLPRGVGRVLVIDDDPAISDIVARALFRSGYTVEVADSVATARAILDERFIPALLVTDVMLPKESGVVGAREFQARIPGLRVLFMSGYSELGLAQAIGSDPFIEKPFTPAQIARRVAEVLAR